MSDVDRIKGYESGGVDYVPVPVVPEILRARVSVFADLYRKRQQLERLNAALEERVAERTAALEAADRRKDEFLAMLSHELRNPLAPMRNAVKIFEILGGPDPRLARARGIIDRQIEHMARLIDDLMDVSRLTQGKITLRPEPLLLKDVVEAAVETTRWLIDERGHTLSVQCADPDLRVNGDRVRLIQVAGNLLANAAKFTPPGGRISVDLARDGDRAVLRVRDTGVGIPPDAQERIFDLFAQEETTLARSRGGLGIGLTMVKRLVELHEGQVSVQCDGPESGSEFTVVLPALEPAASTSEPADPERPTSGSPILDRLRVLVVEDNVEAAETLSTVLMLNGLDVQMAHDGHAALRLIDGFRPDVAFIDLGLPGLDGLEVARRVRRTHPTRPLLIAVSGYGRDEDKARAKDAGFDKHLVKPVQVAAMLACLAQLRASMPPGGEGSSPA
jgi:signal transduction histidine kinase/ActR/RegA family two-component response regulator